MHDKQILYSLRVGDGCYVTQSREGITDKTYNIMCSSINLDYLSHKKSVLESSGIICRPISDRGKSGYKKDSVIYNFSSRVHPLISEVGGMSIVEVIKSLNKIGLIYFFLDDGSFHQKKHFGHIYCNTFNNEEVEALMAIMFKYYPQKMCTKRLDRKKDGRQYPYIYIPVSVMDEFKKDVGKFLEDNGIESLMYKVGK